MEPIRIAVVGAGPSGLTFASILQRKARELQDQGKPVPWTVTLYDGGSGPESRYIGGSLDLGKHTGLAALQAAGLYDRFHDFARPEGQELRLMNHRGETVFYFDGNATFESDRYSPEIDRSQLNQILEESLPKDAIQWGHKLLSVQPCDQGYQLIFTEDRTVDVDVVVGADGAWSRVRPLLTDKKPEFQGPGVTSLDVTIRDVDTRYPEIAALVNQGTLYSFSGGNSIVAQRNSNGVFHVHLAMCTPPDWRQHELFKNAKTDRERLTILATTRFAHWGEKLRELAMVVADNVSDDKDAPTLLSWPFYAMPVGISWENRPNATLIGDAAHLMSPCAGEGVNTAMVDAMELAFAISNALVGVAGKTTESLAKTEAAIAKYECEMFARVEDPTRRSAENLKTFFTEPAMTINCVAKIFPLLFPESISVEA